MAVSFVVVPEWQGSGSARAMRLVDGALAIREDLPPGATVTLDVPLEAGDREGTGIHRFSSLRLVRERFADAVAHLTDPVVLVGGDCAAEYGAVAHAVRRAGSAAPTIVWFDAHPDANGLESSPSGDFNGMVLRALADDGVIDAARIVLAGARSLDAAEDEWITENHVPLVRADRLTDPAALVAAIAATGATSVYLHIDVDVLDPAELRGIGDPEPFGVSAETLLAAIRAVRARFTLAGAGLTQYSPADEDSISDDAGTLLRIIGALACGGADTPAA
ncbi:arginase family protein [Schumannella luteola]|uniref:Arginase n=1 Tax=Schumannella luteola TaxID=472059 RepID=A0A852YKC4_9MICO|nr:arginase family protein [Schumannella luteola]NYG99638.1 arginase [Schumannella luteola]TPX02033.1 arginase family protein [Schumannella luteola]